MKGNIEISMKQKKRVFENEIQFYQMIYLILPLNRKNSAIISSRNYHDYTWIFTSRIFRLSVKITFLLNKYFFLQISFEYQKKRHQGSIPENSTRCSDQRRI